MPHMARLYLALGTNLGDRWENLREAIRRLETFVRVQRISSIYETEPWGITEQPRFFNLVVEGESELEPLALLNALKRVESEMGREPGERYGPRVIDLDILLYADLVLQTDRLEIPHPRMAERRFVLVPLAEIGPNVVHPRLMQTAQELLAQLPDNGDVTRVGAWE